MAFRLVPRAALLALALMLLATVPASATHVRPKGATPLLVELIPAQKPCVDPNARHEPPLEVRSCIPPEQTSSVATVGTPDANGFPAQSTGYVRIDVANVGNQFEDDVVKVSITDVRDLANPSLDYNPNPDGPDMTLAAALPDSVSTTSPGGYRLTDHRNVGPGPVGGAATTVGFQFPIPVDCNFTPPGIGATCSADTSFNAVLPGFVKFDPTNPNGNRQSLEIGQVRIYDAGSDKVRMTNDDTLFGVQGIFNP
jgi:hypothetical protein